MKLFQNLYTDLQKKLFKTFSIYSPGGHFVKQSGRVSANLVDSHLRNIPE